MARPILQELQSMIRDNKVYFALATVKELLVGENRSVLKCVCRTITEGNDRDILARMTWENVGPDAGDFAFPVVGDLVMICFLEGEPDLAFIIRRLTSNEDTIPENALTGDRVIKSLAEKNIWITAQKELYLTKTDKKSTENLVLGQEFKKFASDLLGEIKNLIGLVEGHVHPGVLPGNGVTAPPTAGTFTASKTAIEALKTSPIDDEEVLSSYAFVSKE